MGLAETLRYLSLEITGVVSCFYQAFQERLISSLIGRVPFIHRTSLRDGSTIPQNRE